MIDTQLKPDPRFTPYQADFFRRFTEEVGPGSLHLLVAPVGTGKSFAIAGVVSELARVGRLSRAVVLTAAPLVSQWAYQFREHGQNIVVVDGQRLRSIREATGGTQRIWPEGLYAISIDLAKRSDAEDIVATAPWNLVVVDNAHSLSGDRLRLVERIASAEPPSALLLVAQGEGTGTASFAQRAALVDWTATASAFRHSEASGAPVTCSTVRYRRSSEEAVVAELVVSAAQELEPPMAMTLVKRAASSLRSLEDSLVRWLDSEDEICGRSSLERLLAAVEQLRGDSKLSCFRLLVQEQLERGSKHFVAFCEYRTTMDYLMAAAEGLDVPVFGLHGDLGAEKQDALLERFRADGGILVTTSASEAVSLSFVEAVVHYDLPFSLNAFAAREGRYQRYGRRQACAVYFLEDETGALPVEALIQHAAQKLDPFKDQSDIDLESLAGELVRASVTGERADAKAPS